MLILDSEARPGVWRRLGVGLLVLLGVLALCGLGIIALSHRFDPPTIWRNPPVYPGAQDVATQDWGEPGRPQAGVWNTYMIKVISFTTMDKREQVQAFYENAYSRWERQSGSWGNILPAKDALNFSWGSSAARSPSVYFVNVSAVASSEGATRVEIGVSMFPGY